MCAFPGVDGRARLTVRSCGRTAALHGIASYVVDDMTHEVGKWQGVIVGSAMPV